MSDYSLGTTIYLKFTTRAFATGIPTVLAGTPVVSVYRDNNLTQITAGVTLTVDLDGVVGLNLITIVATAGNGFASDSDYDCVITTGTVDSVSVVGEVVRSFTLDKATANMTAINGNAAAATRLALSAGEIIPGALIGTPTQTSLPTDLTDTANGVYVGRTILITGGPAIREVTEITGYNGTTKTLTVTALSATPVATDPFIIL